MSRRIVVLHGVLDPAGRPDEADTLAQAEQVAGHLTAMGDHARILATGLDLAPIRALAFDPPDLVFNLVEAIEGDCRLAHLAPLMLERLGLRFTGAGSRAIYVSTDKLLTKQLLAGIGLATPEVAHPCSAEASRRWIVKSVHEDASLGLDAGSVVMGGEVRARVSSCRARFGGEWLAEAYIAGREFNLALLEGSSGPELLPIGEIDFTRFPAGRPPIVDYDAKWSPDSATYRTTPRIFTPRPGDDGLRRALADAAMRCWRLLGLRGYARVDFRVDAAGVPWVLEVNANPCLNEDAGYLAAAEEAGLDPRQVIRRIIAAAGG